MTLLVALLLQTTQTPLEDAYDRSVDADWLELATEKERFTLLHSSRHFEVRALATEQARMAGKIQELRVTAENLAAYEKHAEKICEAAEKAVEKYFGEFGYHWPKIHEDIFGPNPTRKKVILVRSLWGMAAGEVRRVYYEQRHREPDEIAVSIERPDSGMFASDTELVDTVTHELFHLVQYGYDHREDRWLMEATAVAMCDQVRPELAGNPAFGVAAFLPTWFGHNDLRLQEWTKEPPRRQYGTSLFFLHALRRHGRDLMLDVWRRAESKRGSNSLEALDGALAAKGSGLKDALADFSDAVLFRDLGEAHRAALASYDLRKSPAAKDRTFPPVWPMADGALVPDRIDVEPLSARYLFYSPAKEGKLTALVGFSDDLRCAIHLRNKDGSWAQGRPWSGTGSSETVEARAAEAVLVIVNAHRTEPRTAEVAWWYDPPLAIHEVLVDRVGRSGGFVYEARLEAGEWVRKKEDPVRVRKGDRLKIEARTSHPAKGITLTAGKKSLPMKRYSENGWLAELAEFPNEETELVLEFRGQPPLDGDARTAVEPRAEAKRFVLRGFEPEPDRAHSFRIVPETAEDFVEFRLTGQIRTAKEVFRHDGTLQRIVPKPGEPFVQAEVAVRRDGRARRIEVRGMESLYGTSRGKQVRMSIVAYVPSAAEYHGKEVRVAPPHSDRVWIGADPKWEKIPEAPFVLGWRHEFGGIDPTDAGGNYVKKGKFRMNGSDGTVEWTGSVTFTELGRDVIAGEFEAPFAIDVGYEDQPPQNGIHGEAKAAGRFRVTGERIAWPPPSAPWDPPPSDEEKKLADRIAELKKQEDATDPNKEPGTVLRLIGERRKLTARLEELREKNRREHRQRIRDEIRDKCLEGMTAPLSVRGK